MMDFTDHPSSVTEVRAGKTEHCADWSPRDALIDLLRRIDAGDSNVNALVIAYCEATDDGNRTRFSMAAPDARVGLGVLSRVAWMINEG